jgi:hypothetical protein
MAVWDAIVLRNNRATKHRAHSEKREIPTGDELSLHARLGRPVDADVDRSSDVTSDIGDVAVAHPSELFVGEARLYVVTLLLSDDEQPLRFVHRQHAPHHGVHQGKDRGVRTHSESERQHHGRRETRTLS